MVDEEQDDVQRFPVGERFHAALMARGTGFAAVVYVLLTVFLLGTVGSIVDSVMTGSPAAAVPSLLIGALLLYFFREENMYGVIATLAFPYLLLGVWLVFAIVPAVTATFGTLSSPTLMYGIVLALPLLALGALIAYLFNAVSLNRRELGGAAIAGSTIIAAGSGLARLVQEAFRRIAAQSGSIDSGAIGGTVGSAGPTTVLGSLNVQSLPDPTALFLVSLIAFNLPFLYYARQRFALGRRDLAWYLLPIGIYLLIGFGGGIVLF